MNLSRGRLVQGNGITGCSGRMLTSGLVYDVRAGSIPAASDLRLRVDRLVHREGQTMSGKGNLTLRDRITLIRALIEWGGDDSHIPEPVATIAERAKTRLGRSVSRTTLRSYLDEAGISYDKTRAATACQQDRISEVAKILQEIALKVGITDEELLQDLHYIATKQRVTKQRTSSFVQPSTNKPPRQTTLYRGPNE